MANFNDLKATIASRIPDNTDQLISAEDVRQSFLDTIDEMNAAKEDNGTVAPTEWGMISGLLTDQDDLETALNGKQAVISDLVTIRQGAAKGNTAYQKPANGIPPSDMTAGAQASLGRADTAYQKPSGGIPKTDLTTAVQSSLGLADSAYQKPSGGIPSNDLASGVRASLARAQSAVQPADLGAVAYSDDYNDLNNKPTIPAAPGALITNITTAQTPSSSEALSGTIKLHKVSKTGSYADLNNKPTIPTVHNMAAGGTTGQVLAKKSNTDYDTEWVNQSGGGGGAAAWGSITGDLDDQTDLKNALAAKQDAIANLATIESGAAAGATAVQPGDLATVATTGDYDDLLNKPTIPTVPTISTDIDTDKASDTKTASPKAVYNFVGDPIVSLTVPTPNDGTVIFTHRSGDTTTLDLNHVHLQYYGKAAGSSMPVGGFTPDEVYALGTISGTVTFSLAAAVSGNVNHYFWTFETGGSAPTVNWPAGLTWADGSAPTPGANKHCEVSILGGVATYLEV